MAVAVAIRADLQTFEANFGGILLLAINRKDNLLEEDLTA